MVARTIQAWLDRLAGGPVGSVSASVGSALRPLATAERALPVLVAAIVAVASMLAVLPTQSAGATGGTSGRGDDVRLAVNGGVGYPDEDVALVPDGGDAQGGGDASIAYVPPSFTPVVIPQGLEATAQAETTSASGGDFLDDGTLLTGYAPQTDVADGADLIHTYKVRSGDTLVTIAHKFGVSMMTLWWANKLESKNNLHIGQTLRIPPVSGLVVTVKNTDTLDSIAAKYDVDAAKVVELNGLDDPTLVVGQVLVLPGATGAPIPTPKPAPKIASKPRVSAGSHITRPRSGGGIIHTGGPFHWPVIGGGNFVSQGFHAGHGAIDIAADYGSPVVAATGGRVIFAGWKSNGGGWQVWISHGGGMYTTYNHMSALSVGTGQAVGRGQHVGRIGASGNATGPHLHFEVWLGGMPWAGGHQVNPMRYF